MAGWSRAESQPRSSPPHVRRDIRRGTSCVRLRRLELAELTKLFEEAVGALGFLGVDLAEREADVDQDVVTDPRLRQMLEADLADGAAEVGAAPSQEPIF